MKTKGISPQMHGDVQYKLITMAGEANYDIKLARFGGMPTIEEIDKIANAIIDAIDAKTNIADKIEELRAVSIAYRIYAHDAKSIDTANELFIKSDQIKTRIIELQEQNNKVPTRFVRTIKKVLTLTK